MEEKLLFNYEDISKEHLDAHINHIINITRSIELNKVTILTGGNALGKSLIRKQLIFHVDAKLTELGIEHNPKRLVSSISMQLRTEDRPEWGALSSMSHDLPWTSTSYNTVNLINKLITSTDEGKRFIIIDELEIGMSREVQVGTCKYLNSVMKDLLDKSYGVLIITHSEDVVEALNHDNWINIEGLSEEDWIMRDVIPVMPEQLSAWAKELFIAVRDRDNKN